MSSHVAILPSAELKSQAQLLGFGLVGIGPAVTPAGINDFLHWLERGFAGEMAYLPRRQAAYAHPRHVLDGARSVVMLGMNYNVRKPAVEPSLAQEPIVPARVARYARGRAD